MKRAILAGCLLMLSAGPAWPQTYSGDTDAVTNQRFGNKSCDTTGNLPADVYSMVSSTASFEPCHQAQVLGQGAPGENCDSTYPPPSNWSFVGHGHLTFGPPSSGTPATKVEVQYWYGQTISSCVGGTVVTCPGGALGEDSTFPVGALNLSVPFDWGNGGSINSGDPTFAVPFYVFAKPIGGSVQCTANNITTEENNSGVPTPTPTGSAMPSATPTPTLDVTNIVLHQGGGQKPCVTGGNLPANTFSLLSADNAGQPCTNSSDLSHHLCDSNSKWNYTVHGHLTMAPPTSGTQAPSVEIQTYIGGNRIACSAGSSITCTGSFVLVEDSTYSTAGTTTESIPFDMGEVLLPAHDSSGGSNFQAYFVFGKPIGGSLRCLSNIYSTTEHN
jgi:hypothetical protein